MRLRKGRQCVCSKPDCPKTVETLEDVIARQEELAKQKELARQEKLARQEELARKEQEAMMEVEKAVRDWIAGMQ